MNTNSRERQRNTIFRQKLEFSGESQTWASVGDREERQRANSKRARYEILKKNEKKRSWSVSTGDSQYSAIYINRSIRWKNFRKSNNNNSEKSESQTYSIIYLENIKLFSRECFFCLFTSLYGTLVVRAGLPPSPPSSSSHPENRVLKPAQTHNNHKLRDRFRFFISLAAQRATDFFSLSPSHHWKFQSREKKKHSPKFYLMT